MYKNFFSENEIKKHMYFFKKNICFFNLVPQNSMSKALLALQCGEFLSDRLLNVQYQINVLL